MRSVVRRDGTVCLCLLIPPFERLKVVIYVFPVWLITSSGGRRAESARNQMGREGVGGEVNPATHKTRHAKREWLREARG